MGACPNLLELARLSVQRTVRPGDLAVDATAGKGNDTLFLAELVGSHGLVLAFDIQPEALEATRALLAQASRLAQVRLFLTGHENIAACLPGNPVPPPTAQLAAGLASAGTPDMQFPSANRAKVSAAMFNLGFLPGSEKEIVTRPSTTLAALNGLMPALHAQALLTVHCYSGHDGGREESNAVLEWARALPEELWRVLRYETFNKRRGVENLLLIERRPIFSR